MARCSGKSLSAKNQCRIMARDYRPPTAGMSSTIFDRWPGGSGKVKIHRCYPAAIIQAALLTIVSAYAQDTTTDGYVTRKEYDELKVELLSMKKELDALKKEKGAVSKQGSVESHSVAETHKEVAPRQEEAEAQAAGE